MKPSKDDIDELKSFKEMIKAKFMREACSHAV